MDAVIEVPLPVASIYESMDAGPKSFRLLELSRDPDGARPLRGMLTKFSREDKHCSPYVALLYAWGKVRNTRSILINGHVLEIGEKLHAALLHLQIVLPASIMLWIDAICINQNDIQERSEQVQHMREIYSNANEVVIWLGPSFGGSDELFAYIKEHEARCFTEKADSESCTTPFGAELQSRLRTLIRLPYWKRYWIVQEFVLAQNARLLCGLEFLRREDFIRIIYEYSNPPSGHFVPTALEMTQRDYFDVGQIVKIGTWREQELSIHLAEAMDRTRMGDSTDPRDKVFAILGLVTEGAGRSIAVDYTHSPCTVYCTAIEAMMKDRQDLDDITRKFKRHRYTYQHFVSNTEQCLSAIDDISQECRKAAVYRASTSLFGAPSHADERMEVEHQCNGILCGSRVAMWLVAGWHKWSKIFKHRGYN
jgi:hypothetical protein